MTSMWSDTNPIGNHHDAPDPVLGELVDAVVDVGLQPRHARRARTASRRPAPSGSGGPVSWRIRSPISSATDTVLGDVRAAVRARTPSFIASGSSG